MITCENSHLLQDAYIHEDDYATDYEVRYYLACSVTGKVLWEDKSVFTYTGPAPVISCFSVSEASSAPIAGWVYGY